jgi:hypothetical protein
MCRLIATNPTVKRERMPAVATYAIGTAVLPMIA